MTRFVGFLFFGPSLVILFYLSKTKIHLMRLFYALSIVFISFMPLIGYTEDLEVLKDKHLEIMVKAAREAGKILLEGYNQIGTVAASAKSSSLNDLVTEYDVRAEQSIIAHLTKAFPEYGIIAEESTKLSVAEALNLNKAYAWVIDPLDGTTSFTYKRPHFCTSIGLIHNGVPIAGVIYNPVIGELFYASKGNGAYCNGRKITVSNREKVEASLFHVGVNKLYHLEKLQKLLDKAARINRFGGSAALDLAWVAMGRIDAYIVVNLKPWDIAAGAILVQEAGGAIMEPNGEANYLASGHIMAGNEKLLRTMSADLFPGVTVDGVPFGASNSSK